jgi:hypothetical protein
MTCDAGMYPEYCDDNESLCCEEESSICHSRLGMCIDLRHDKCESKKLVLGYCEDWENPSATPYKAFCCNAGVPNIRQRYSEETLIFQWNLALIVISCIWIAFSNPFIVGMVDGSPSWLLLHQVVGSVVIALLTIGLIPYSPDTVPLYPSPSIAPTFSPSYSPTSFPSFPPTYSPTPLPSASPSKTISPTISFSPTTSCPIGFQRELGGNCVKCENGKYTDQTNQLSCQSCEPWSWTLHEGSSSCDYTTARNSIPVGSTSFICSLYVFLSLVCYGLTVYLGGSPGTIVTIALITTDQVTDILYAWYSLFADPSLLYLSFIFCLANLLVPLIYLLYSLRVTDLLVTKWLNACSDAYDEFDRRHGHYQEGEEPKYSAWLLHSILGFTFCEFFPYSLLFIPVEILWILLRIFINLVVILSAILSQIVLLLIGGVLYVNKLMSIVPVYTWFWTIWNPNHLETHPQETADDGALVYNALVLVEVFFECIPQIAIQLVNTGLILGADVKTWPTLTIVSLSLSTSMITSILHHYGYKHYQLLHDDPTYASFDLRRIPKFDLFAKFINFSRNRRQYRTPQNQQSEEQEGKEIEPVDAKEIEMAEKNSVEKITKV